ncbi:YolD-like family protein [Gracilibacillus alcaliphilus]|uniref:YolD-like family protein n=1 Tax=Gracilibacillus alcaliphilus TaxID=1401441 RepID=UPI001957959A|nr:YolD-like family protein [Gracilibacillus alcaliphilus]MBM7679259.1 hypothetical protein [Gracilibacillus alcaliphilus]
MNVNDRGNKKWSAMMLPEHVVELKKLKKEVSLQQKPSIDEQQFQEFNFRLALAQKDNLCVEVKYFHSGSIKIVKGYVDMINYVDQFMVIEGIKLNPVEILDVIIT